MSTRKFIDLQSNQAGSVVIFSSLFSLRLRLEQLIRQHRLIDKQAVQRSGST